MKTLIIEDNPSLSRNLVKYLSLKDIASEVSFDWQDWLYKASINYYDVIILDINLPIIDWLEVCKKLREKWKDTPIIMLTSRWTKEDIINWLDIGADDYLVKPFDYDELIARMKTLTRRDLKNKSNTIINIWDFSIDLEKIEVMKNNEIIKLSNLEFELFKYLAQNKWKVVSRKDLYEKVWWEYDDFVLSKTVDVYIWYLRKKLWKELIETIKWVWYIIN
jgi:DNA-binding response OmpR family regulator